MAKAVVLRFIALASLYAAQGQAQQSTAQPSQLHQSLPLQTPVAEEASSTQLGEGRPWRIQDARFILGAERLTNVGGRYYNAVRDGEKIGEASVTEVGFLYSGQDLPRLTFDFAHHWTLGGTIGYRGNTSHFESTETPVTITQSTMNRNLLVGMRGGFIISASQHLSVWLRLGYEYQYDWLDSEGRLPTEKFETHSIVFDPRLILAPVAHVGVSIGPYAQFEYGKDKTDRVTSLDPLSLIGFRGGLSLDLYAFIGGQ